MLLQTGKTTTTVTEPTRTLVLSLSPSRMGKKNKNIMISPQEAAKVAAIKRAENTVTSSPSSSSLSGIVKTVVDGRFNSY